LIAAMAADVDLLVLDEPTAGLDPLMEQIFQDLVRERRDAGCTVLLSSHILGEVEALADRVTIIRSGRTVKTGSLAELRRDTRVAVHALTQAEPSFTQRTPTMSGLETHRAGSFVATTFKVDPNELDAAIGELHRVGIHTLTVSPPSLDELFLQSYRSGAPGHERGGAIAGRAPAEHHGGVER
jgi:ABC-2 type transport system ATP-binding protein